MRILIIGGTVFLGRALVERALVRGHTLTLFNRGKSNSGLFPEVEQIHGDRRTDLGLLKGRQWDAVIDTCGYIPREVRLSAEALADVPHYTFVSTLSVYADTGRIGQAEDGALATMPDPAVEEVTGETYGPLKVLCEQAAEELLPGRVFIPRPGLIVGPYDPTDRFTYWPHRVAQGGDVLVPGQPDRPIQFVDVRDLAGWMIHMIEGNRTSVYNAVGPDPVTMGQWLDACKAASGRDARLVWVSESFLLERNVAPWAELPLWMPESNREVAGFFTFDNRKATVLDEPYALKFRPVIDTVRDTLAWDATRPADHAWRAGLSREREAELLREWARTQE